MKELISYLIKNKIIFDEIDDFFVSIDSEIYFLVYPSQEDKIFSDKFILMADEDDCEKYVYKFGDNWYWEHKSDSEKPKLNELKYIGRSLSTLSTNNFLGIRGAYEILNGSRLYENWCRKAKFLQCKALGICEKNTLAGVLKFQIECKKNNIKSIIGATYTVFRESEDFKYDIKVYVKNETGWQNLLMINKEVNVINHHFVYESRLFELLDGLFIILDPKSINFNKVTSSLRERINFYQLDTVEYVNDGRDQEYLENLKMYVRSDINPVAITDAFYLNQEDSHIKKILNNISGNREYESINQFFKNKEDYYNELESLFDDLDESFYDIFEIALRKEQDLVNQCNFKVNTSEKHLPIYIMTPEEKETYIDNESMYWSLIEKGLKEKTQPNNVNRYIDQIDKEYDIIDYGNLQDYFLINWEQTEWCRRNNIMTGLSRGSAAGFQTSNILNITKIDPFDYDLIAERFLTKERAKNKIADIDIDNEQQRREEVKQHLIDKYGFEQCCSVGTFGTFQIKGGLKDLCKLDGIAFAEVNYVSSVLGEECKEWSDIFRVASTNVRLKAFIQHHSNIFVDLFLILNAKKSISIHASAFIITPSDKTIYEWMPVKKDIRDGVETLISEWEGVELEEAGFLKQDILGLLQLDKFHKIVDLVKENRGVDLNIYTIPLNCQKTLSYFGKGWNEDVFQFGAKGLSNYCKELNPENINDLIATVALYRPGAMENNFHNEYLLRKNGKKEIDYYSGTKLITKNTFGLLVYQEQIMKICQELAGFDLAQTDDIRKALGKKKAEILIPYKQKFIENSIKNGYDKIEMISLWNAMEKFSGYSFNLAHAAAYGITGYISQWFKANYSIEFWTTAFEFSKSDQIADYISEINQIGDIEIMAADVNKSRDSVFTDFKKKTIYWPLSSIKQCGDIATTQIMEIRDRDGQYFSFEEFIERNRFKGGKVGKAVVENMIMSGAFDDLEAITLPRNRYKLILQYRKINKTKIDNEKDIFETNKNLLQEDWWWTLQQKRLSGIAFFNYQDLVERYLDSDYETIHIENFQLEGSVRRKVKIGGYLAEFEERNSKKGKWARIRLESNYTFINITIWSEQYKQIEKLNLVERTKSLLLISGQIVWDSYKKENVLQTTDESELIILE